jgi:hypothetical protein
MELEITSLNHFPNARRISRGRAAVVSSPMSRFAFLPGAAAASAFDVAPDQLHVEASARGWSMRGRSTCATEARQGPCGERWGSDRLTEQVTSRKRPVAGGVCTSAFPSADSSSLVREGPQTNLSSLPSQSGRVSALPELRAASCFCMIANSVHQIVTMHSMDATLLSRNSCDNSTTTPVPAPDAVHAKIAVASIKPNALIPVQLSKERQSRRHKALRRRCRHLFRRIQSFHRLIPS